MVDKFPSFTEGPTPATGGVPAGRGSHRSSTWAAGRGSAGWAGDRFGNRPTAAGVETWPASVRTPLVREAGAGQPGGGVPRSPWAGHSLG